MVFTAVKVCHDCRIRVISYWTEVLEFNLAPHPFIDEFMGVESSKQRNERLESYQPTSEMDLFYRDDSENNFQEPLDFLDLL